MNKTDLREQFTQAVNELATMLDQKERLEVEIAKQRRKVAAWEELVETDHETAPQTGEGYLAQVLDLGGLTDACRTVLRGSQKTWMTTADIQSSLKGIGFPLSKYKAPNASITTTLNRMTEGENPEVVANRRGNPGATEYRWVGRVYGAPNSLASQDARGELRRDTNKPLAHDDARTS